MPIQVTHPKHFGQEFQVEVLELSLNESTEGKTKKVEGTRQTDYKETKTEIAVDVGIKNLDSYKIEIEKPPKICGGFFLLVKVF